jgi:hypothetical protein
MILPDVSAGDSDQTSTPWRTKHDPQGLKKLPESGLQSFDVIDRGQDMCNNDSSIEIMNIETGDPSCCP